MANQNQNQQQYHQKDVYQIKLPPQQEVVVVMVPLPAHGHLNQLLQLSTLILSHNIPVHFVGTTIHNRQAKLRSTTTSTTIQFHDFEIPPFFLPPPDPNSKDKFPSHLLPSFKASSSQLREPVSLLLRSLSSQSRKLIIIHDSLMASVVQEVRFLPNAESYTFHSISAFAIYLFKKQVLRTKTNGGEMMMIRATIKEAAADHGFDQLPSLEGCYSEEFLEFVSSQYGYQLDFSSGFIYNTCKVLEGEYVEFLEKDGYFCRGKRSVKHWALGPFNPLACTFITSSKEKHYCLEWLDQQEANSVIYVSFGTTITMEDEQIRELANGLKQSNHKFIWVRREADKGDIDNTTTTTTTSNNNNNNNIIIKEHEDDQMIRSGGEDEGDLLANGRMGLVVTDWAPQLEILGHKAIGGFMSHCGWNSCLESITMGVPVVAWPMHSDQPRNAFLLAKALKVGIVIREWDKRDEIVRCKVVERAVKRLMGSKEGDNLRKRAKELGEAVRQSVVEEGGSSRLEFDSFIQHITR